jgi:hypothetical protein
MIGQQLFIGVGNLGTVSLMSREILSHLIDEFILNVFFLGILTGM